MRRYRRIFQTVSTLLTLSLLLPPHAASWDWSQTRKSSLRPTQEGTQQAGLEERLWSEAGLEEPIAVYLDPQIKEGRLVGSPKPFRKVGKFSPGLWKLPEVQRAEKVVLSGIGTFKRAKVAGFAFAGNQYNTTAPFPFDPKRPLRLLLVLDAKDRSPRAAYNQETGEQVFQQVAPSRKIQVYLDPPLQNGKILGGAPPWGAVRNIRSSFWEKPEIQQANTIVFSGLTTSDERGKAVFSLGIPKLTTGKRFDPQRPLTLLVVADPKSRMPIVAYDEKTGEAVFSQLDRVQVYLDPPLENGRLLGNPEPYRSLGVIQPALWRDPKVRQAKVVVLANVSTSGVVGSSAAFSIASRSYRTTRPYDSKQPLRLLIQVNPDERGPIVAYDQSTGEVVYSPEDQIKVYLDPKIREGRLFGRPKWFKSIWIIRPSFWRDPAVQEARVVAFSGVATYPQRRKHLFFSLGSRDYPIDLEPAPNRRVRLLVLADPQTKVPLAAYDLMTGEPVYPVSKEKRIQVYLNPPIEQGRLPDSLQPFRTMNLIRPSFWSDPQVQQATTVAFKNIRVFNADGIAVFSFRNRQHWTGRRFDSQRPWRLLLVVDPKAWTRIAAYDQATGEQVYPRPSEAVAADERLRPLAEMATPAPKAGKAGLEEPRIAVYLDPELKEGRLIGRPAPYLLSNGLTKKFYSDPRLSQARQIVLVGLTAINVSGRAVFAVNRKRYPTKRRFNPNRPLRLMVVVNAKTWLATAAYDVSTGEKVYDAGDLIQIYLDPEVQDGRLTSPQEPFRYLGSIHGALWKDPKVRSEKVVALAGVKAFRRGRRGQEDQPVTAGFAITAIRQYSTTKLIGPNETLRLLVLVDPRKRIPLSAYDLATGEKVYDAQDLIRVYLDPKIQNGRLVNPGEPYRRVATLQSFLWNLPEVRKAHVVALEGIRTTDQGGKIAAFTMAKKNYYTTLQRDPYRPFRLLVLADSKTQEALSAYDMATGEKVYGRERLIRVYLDSEIGKGRLVIPEKPYRVIGAIRPEFWEEEPVKQARQILFWGIRAFETRGPKSSKSRFGFSLNRRLFRTTRLFERGHPLRLLLVADPVARTPLIAYDLATAEKVYDAQSLIQVYLNPTIREGRLVDTGKPYRSLHFIHRAFWKDPVVQRATQIAFMGVTSYKQKMGATFNFAGRMYTTNRPFDPERLLTLLVIVDPKRKVPQAAYDKETGEQVYPRWLAIADERLRPLAEMATRTPKAGKAGLEEGELIHVMADVQLSLPLTAESVTEETERVTEELRDKFQETLKVHPIPSLEASSFELGNFEITLQNVIYYSPDEWGETIILDHVLANSIDAIADRLEIEKGSNKEWVGRIDLVVKRQADTLVFEVRDNGIGISKDYLERRLFRRGFTTKKGKARAGGEGRATRRAYGHTLVAFSRGSVEVDSRQLGGETAWRSIWDPTKKKKEQYRLEEAERDEVGTTVRWKFPRFFSGAGLEEPPLAPIRDVETAEDGVTIPLPSDQTLKIILPEQYRQKGKRLVTIRVDTKLPVYPREIEAPQERLVSGGRLNEYWVVTVSFEDQGQPIEEHFAFTWSAAGFQWVHPGLTPLFYLATSQENWLDRENIQPLAPFQVLTAKNGYVIEVGRGTFPDGSKAKLRLELPKDRYQGRGVHPVVIQTQWQENLYLKPDGSTVGGYVVSVAADSGTPEEQTYRFRFTGGGSGFARLEMQDLLNEVAEVATVTSGSPGDLLDVLLVLYGERYTAEQLKGFVRRFEELNLGELIRRTGGRSGRGRGQILLDFYFQQAALISQKEQRDQETLIEVFLKVAFRDLMKPTIRRRVFEDIQLKLKELKARGIQVDFFQSLEERTRELVEKAMAFQPAHLKTELLPHQSVGSYFLRHHNRVFLGDFTGAGKTIEVLGAMDPGWKTFVAAPANLIDTWRQEIKKHMDPKVLETMEIVVLRGGSPEERRRLMESVRHKKRCLIIGSIQSLPRHTAKELEGLLHDLDLLVVDESQFGANYRGEGVRTNAQRAEALQGIPAPRKWYLSATGYGADPEELFATLRALIKGTPEEEQLEFPDDFKRFKKLYPTDKAAGLRYLRGLMRSRSLNRQEDEVMDRYEDPAVSGVPLANQGRRLPAVAEQPYQELGSYELNEEQVDMLLRMIDNFRDFAEWYNQRVPASEQLTERQMNPFLKLDFAFYLLADPKRVGGTTESALWGALDRVVDRYLAQGKKGILYTNNIFVTERILERCRQKGIGVARIDSTVSGFAHDREGRILKGYFSGEGELVLDPSHPEAQNVDAKTYQRHLFQTDPNVRLIVVGTRAGGIGLDITAAEFMVEVQLPEVYTQEKQTDGRPIRVDPKRPRLQVDKIRMVAVFPKGFADRYRGTQYEELAQRFADSGTPDEILVERLSRGKRRFQYVMTDLATEEDLDLFDRTSLANAIPGYNEDPTVEQYYASLASRRLRQTLEIFLPLYLRAQTHEKRQEVLRLAELFFRTGQAGGIETLIALLFDEDESVLRLISSLGEIPNKYARLQWVSRVVRLITEDLPANEVRLKDIAEAFDFLMEEAPFLILPLYEATKGFENGQALTQLHALLAEISEAHRDDPQAKRFLYQTFVLWLLAVDPAARDALKEVFELHGEMFIDSAIPLEERLKLSERLLRTISFPRTKDILLTQARAGNMESFNKALDQAVVAAAEDTFGLSRAEAERLADRFPAILTALQIQRVLQNQPHLSGEFHQINEVLRHVAQGDYLSWRNEQKGGRASGKRVTYLENQPEFWRVFSREESITLQGLQLGFEQHREQLVKVVNQLMEMLTMEGGRYVGEVDGDWVRKQFLRWMGTPEKFVRSTGPRRKVLGGALHELRQGNLEGLSSAQREALVAEGIEGFSDEAATSAVESRLREYGQLGEWVRLLLYLQELPKAAPAPQQLAEIRTEVSKLIGRARRRRAHKTADHLELLPDLLERLRQQDRYDKIAVELTTDPSLMIERGMLQPRLVDCFNCYADPEHISTLADDLGSRNKLLAIVRDTQGHIVARSIVKVKRLEDGTPVLFPERPLYVGGYDFEPEILEALRQTKLKELASFGAHLAREPTDAEKKQGLSLRVFDTGGYSDREYIEPLFGIRDRATRRGPIYHSGILVNGPSVVETKAQASFGIDFLSGVGYQGITPENLVKLLQVNKIDVVIDVRDYPGGRRKEFSKVSLEGTLQQAGIGYRHVRALGAPKELRDAHRLGENDQEFMRSYRTHVQTHPEVQHALDSLKPLLHGKRVCLLCYEANPHQCHRLVIAEELSKQATIANPIIDLNAPLLPLIEPKESKAGLEEEIRAAAKEYTLPFLGGLGYQGLEIQEFVRLLQSQRIQLVVDVREMASSRKKGFSKGALTAALNDAGIQYLHARPLGTPKAMRDSHQLGRNDQAFRRAYAKFLKTRRKELEALLPEMNGKRVCLLCYEADPHQCHRLVIAQELLKRVQIIRPVVDLRAPRLPLLKPQKEPKSGLEEEKIEVYLDPQIEDGRLLGSPQLFWSGSSRAASGIWKFQEVQKAHTVALANLGTATTNNLQAFSIGDRYFYTTRKGPLSFRLIVIVDPKSLTPLSAFDQATGEQVYSFDNLIRIYLDPVIQEGRLLGNPSPFLMKQRSIPSRLWKDPAIERAQTVVLASLPAFNDHGLAALLVFRNRYRTNRAFEPNLRFLVVVDAKTRIPRVAYDMATGEEVFRIEELMHVYLDPTIENGRLVGGPTPFRVVRQIQPPFWDLSEVRAAKTIVMSHVPVASMGRRMNATFSFAGHQYDTKQYHITKKYDPTLRLLVVGDVQAQLPLVAYDQQTGETVFRLEDFIRVYLDPVIQEGRLAGHPEPFKRWGNIQGSIWSECIKEGAERVVFTNIRVRNDRGIAAYSMAGQYYYTLLPFRPGMRLLVVVDPKSRIPIVAYDQATGRTVFRREDQILVYLDPSIQDGKLVGQPILFRSFFRSLFSSFWRNPLVQKATTVALANVHTFNLSSPASTAFSIAGQPYRVARRLSSGQSPRLLVLVDPKTQTPTAAYDQATGERVYPRPGDVADPRLKLLAEMAAAKEAGLEELKPVSEEEIPVSQPGLAAVFLNGWSSAKSIQGAITSSNPTGADAVTLYEIPFTRRQRGNSVVWAFPKEYAPAVADHFHLIFRSSVQAAHPDAIKVTGKGLAKIFQRGPELIRTTKSIQAALKAANLENVNTVTLGGVQFTRRKSRVHIVWTFSKQDALTVAEHFGLDLRAPLEKLRADEIPVSVSGFEVIFIGGQKAPQKIRQAILSSNSTDADTLILHGITFVRRLSGGKIVWAFSKQYAPSVAQHFGFVLRPRPLQEIRPDEIGISGKGLVKVFSGASHRLSHVADHIRSILEVANLHKEDTLTLDEIPFARRKLGGGKTAWSFPSAYAPQFAQRFGLAFRSPLEELHPGEIPVSVSGFMKIFIGGSSILSQGIKIIQAAQKLPTRSPHMFIFEGVPLTLRKRSNNIVWSFPETHVPQIARYLGLRLRVPIEELHADEIAISRKGLKAIFMGDFTKTTQIKTIRATIETANVDNDDAITLDGVPFVRRKRGGSSVWAFPKIYVSDFARHFHLTLRPEADPRLKPIAEMAAAKEAGLEELQPISQDEIALSAAGLRRAFRVSQQKIEQVTQGIRAAIADANPTHVDTVILDGVPFTRRRSGVHILWSFPKHHASAVARRFGLTLRSPLEDLKPDEIAVSGPGLNAILINGQRVAQPIQQAIDTANLTNADTLTLHGVPFIRRKSGPNVVWSFPKGYAIQLAKRFGLILRPEVLIQADARLSPLVQMAARREEPDRLKRISPHEVAVSMKGLKVLFTSDYRSIRRSAKAILSAIEAANPHDANAIILEGIPFNRRKRGTKTVWTFPREYASALAQQFHLTLRPPPLEQLHSDEIAISRRELAAVFTRPIPLQTIQAAIHNANSLDADTVTLDGIPLTRRIRGGHIVWSFPRRYTPQFGQRFQLTLSSPAEELHPDEIPISSKAFRTVFIGGLKDLHRVATAIRAAIRVANPKDLDAITLEGIPLSRRKSGPHTIWAFPKVYTAELAKRFGLRPRPTLEDLHADEIAISQAGLKTVFVGNNRHLSRVIKMIQSRIGTPVRRDTNTVILEDVPFIRRRSATQITWAFQRQYAPAVAARFGLTLRPEADPRLKPIAEIAAKKKVGLEEALEELVDSWGSLGQGTDALVMTQEAVDSQGLSTLRNLLQHLPYNLARRTYLVNGSLEDLALKILQQTPSPERVWVLGSLPPAFIRMLSPFRIPVYELKPGLGLEELLAQLGILLGVPASQVESGLEELKGSIGLAAGA